MGERWLKHLKSRGETRSLATRERRRVETGDATNLICDDYEQALRSASALSLKSAER